MHHILFDIGILFLFSALIILFCSKFNIPTILGYLLTGLVVGPNVAKFVTVRGNVEVMAEVGIILLLFAIGLEFSLKQLILMKKIAIIGGLSQVLLTILVTAGLVYIIKIPLNVGIFLGMLVSLSSTAIVLKFLGERGEVDTPQGRSTVGILIFQDIAVIPMMLIVPMLAGGSNVSVKMIFLTLGKALVIVILLFTLSRVIVPRLLRAVAQTRNSELFMITTILICAMVAFATYKADISLALGAFLAGVVISESGYGYQALGHVTPFKDVFTGFFFISVGMLIDPAAFLHFPITIIAGTIAIIVLKTAIIALIVSALGKPLKISIITGLNLAQIGEFAFVLAGIGFSLGIINNDTNMIFIAVAVLTMALTPFLIKGGQVIADTVMKLPFPNQMVVGYGGVAQAKATPNDHIIVIGLGVVGRNLVNVAKKSDIEYVIIDSNPDRVKSEHDKGESIIFGDATNPVILEKAHLHTARMVVITMSASKATAVIVELARRLAPTLAIITRAAYESEEEHLIKLGANDIVVEEQESSVGIVNKVIKRYFASTEDLTQYEAEIRGETAELRLGHEQLVLGGFQLDDIVVNVVSIPVGASSDGKSLKELNIAYKYNITILAVKRGKETFSIPKSNFEIHERDEILVIGYKNNILKFEEELKIKEA